MDPTTVFCPNGHCPARGQSGQGNIGIYLRKEQRFLCHAVAHWGFDDPHMQARRCWELSHVFRRYP